MKMQPGEDMHARAAPADARPGPPSRQEPKAFHAEWSRAADTVRAEAIEIVRSLGCGNGLIDHIGNLQIYPRIPYLTAGWIDDDAVRERLGKAVSLHAIGLKLLDDLVDGDCDLPLRDLLTGHVVTHAALTEFYAASGGGLLVGDIAAWLPIYRYIRHEALTPLEDLRGWVDGARRKSLLYLYVEALYRERRPEICDAVREAFELFVALGQVVDDYKDRDGVSETGNLILMIADGRVAREDALAWADATRRRISGILHEFPPALGCGEFIEELGSRASAVIAA